MMLHVKLLHALMFQYWLFSWALSLVLHHGLPSALGEHHAHSCELAYSHTHCGVKQLEIKEYNLAWFERTLLGAQRE
jgi:hypothetical protein